MSSENNSNKQRTVEEIRNEYTQVCAKLGHLSYQLYVVEKDRKLVMETLEELNFEAAKASAKEVAQASVKDSSAEGAA